MNDPQTAPLRALQFLLTHAAVQYPEAAAEARGLQAELTVLEKPPAPVAHPVPRAPVLHAVPPQPAHPAAPVPPAAPHE